MTISANQYASKVYSEHPIALWPLDEQAYYLSLIDDTNRLFSNWSNGGEDRVNLIGNPNFETNTTGWVAGSNVTIARDTNYSYSGSASLKVTKISTATGNSYASATIAGIKDQTYTLSAWVRCATGTVTGGRLVLTDGSTNTNYNFTATEQWTRVSVTKTPGSGLAVGGAYLTLDLSTTNGAAVYFDNVMVERSPTVGTYFDGSNGGGAWTGAANNSASVIHAKDRINLVPNPSVETNATGWNGNNTSSAVRSTAQAYIGSASLLATYNTVGGGAGVFLWQNAGTGPGYLVTEGKVYTFSIYVRDASATKNYYAFIDWRNSDTGSGTLISTTNGLATSCTLNTWTRVTVTGIAPVGAKSAVVACYTSGAVTAGNTAYFDGALFEESDTAYPYFDGSTTSVSYGGTAYTIAPTWSGTAHASTSTLTQWTASNSPTIPDAPSPFDSDIYSAVTKSNAIAGTVEAESNTGFGILDLDPSASTVTVNAFLYQNPTYINWFKIGIRYVSSGVTNTLYSDEIPSPDAVGWINLNNTFTLPTTFTGDIKIVIQVNFMDSTAGDTASRTVIMNGLSVGQGSSLTCYESLGSTAIDLPADLNLSSAKGISADQYGVLSDNGYYVVKNNALLAHNDSMSMIYGTDNCTKIEASGTSLPSFIFPGKGMLHENGRSNEYTMEMWIKVDPQTSSAFRIIGPLDGVDGVYVKEGFITLAIGNERGSHYVGEWYRPMLLHIVLKSNNALLMINGEEVVNIPFDRYSATLSSLRDWWGVYSQNSTRFFSIDCIGIYPYIVSSMVAKRRFVYGQGTPNIQALDAAYSGSPTTIDFSTSEYTANVIYPDAYRWDAGYFNNLTATRDYLSVPKYSLPVINIGGRDLTEWYEDNYTVNTLEYPSGNNPKFVTFRPNFGFKSVEREFNDAAVNMDDAGINIDGYTAGVEYGWYPEGNNYQEQAYFNFPSLSVLNDRVAAVYGIFQIESQIATNRTLMSFSNTVNGDKFDITIYNDEVTYSLNETVIFVDVVAVGTGFLVGINIDDIGTQYGYEVSKFFSSPSSIQLYIGGNGLNTFEGKIYLVGISNDNNLLSIESNFYQLGEVGAGFIKSENYEILTDHLASYTLVPEYEYGKFFLDISVSSEWEEFYPLSYFASYVKDENGNSVYDLDMLQLNLGYVTVESTGVWTYQDLKDEFPSPNDYADLAASVYSSSYFSLKKKNTAGTAISVSGSSLQGYVTFQSLAEGANKPLQSFQYSKLIDADHIIYADQENTILIPDKAYYTKFSFVDDMIVFPPKSKPFEDYAMVVHLQIGQRSILNNPLKIRKLEITSKNYNSNLTSGLSQSTNIGTKFGTSITPYIQELGNLNNKGKKPFSISKETTPYLYTSSKSGIGVRKEALQDGVPISDTQIFIPINKSGAAEYLVSALQLMIKPEFDDATETIKLFEVRHKGGTTTYSANKIGLVATMSSYSSSGNGYLIDGGSPSTASHIDNFDGGIATSSYPATADYGSDTSQDQTITDVSYAAGFPTSYYQNGRYVPSPILNNNEWSVIGLIPNESWDFGNYDEGGITIYGGARFNNISYYLSQGLGIQSELSTRVWQDVLDANGVGVTLWSYWDGNSWQNVYILGQTSSFVITPIDLYDSYVGTNGSVIDDGYGLSLIQGQMKVVSDVTWSSISMKPV